MTGCRTSVRHARGRASARPFVEQLERRDVPSTFLNANESLVQGLYTNFLGRTGVENELDAWTGLLPVLGQGGIAAGLVQSPEALGHLTDGVYVDFLGRHADAQGQQAWVNLLANGETQEHLIAAVLSSPEFAGRANQLVGGANADANYARAVYRLVLNRTGSDAEINAWVGALPTLGRVQMALSILMSPEFRQEAVRTLYGDALLPFLPDLLQRTSSPSAAEQLAWAGSSLDLLSMLRLMAGTQEYFTAAQSSDLSQYLLTISGVQGEGPKGALTIKSWSWNETNPNGSVVMGEFSFTKLVDKASPALFLAAVNGTPFAQATLTCRKAGGQQQTYLVYTLTNVLVSSYQVGGQSHGDIEPQEQFSLNFAKITQQYNEILKDGSEGPAIMSSYDLTNHTGSGAFPGAAAETASTFSPFGLALPGSPGEGNKGEIIVDGWSLSPGSPGTPAQQHFQITDVVSQVSPAAVFACASGQHLDTAQLNVRRSDATSINSYHFTLVAIVSYSISSGLTHPTETLAFSFATVTIGP